MARAGSSTIAWNVQAKLSQLAEQADEEDRRIRRRKLLGYFLVVALLCVILFTLSFPSTFSPSDSFPSAQSFLGSFSSSISSSRPSYPFSSPFLSRGAASTHTLPDNSEVLVCAANTTRANAATYTKADPNFPRPIPWVPQRGKYLLATCVRGRLTNRHECLHKSLLVAMLLNRTLIVPPLDVCPNASFFHPQYNLANSVDLDHLVACFGGAAGGPATQGAATAAGAAAAAAAAGADKGGMAPGAGPGVVTLQQYLQSNNLTMLTVNLLACGIAYDLPPESCPSFSACKNDPKVIPIAFLSGHSTFTLPAGRLSDLASRLHQALPQASNVPVLCLGDLLYVDTSEIREEGPFLPRDILPTECSFALRPPPNAVAAAAWFMQEYTGQDFAALHLRRGDFYPRFRWSQGTKADYFPMETIADYIVDTIAAVNAAAAAAAAEGGIAGAALQVGATGSMIGEKGSCLRESSEWRPIRMLVLCSDAGERQESVLSRLLAVHGITVVRLDVSDPAFAFSGVKIHAPGRADAVVMAEKVVAANARIVFYSWCSSFSQQIKHIRESLGRISCWDSILCEGRSKEVALVAAGLYD